MGDHGVRVEKIGDATLYLADCNDVLPLIKGGGGCCDY